MSIEIIQKTLNQYGELISAPRSLLRVFTGPQTDGSPYVEESNGKYFYKISEKGMIFEERETKDPDELLYWLLNDVISQMSYEYELNMPSRFIDPRRVAFPLQVKLFFKINPIWAERRQQEIDEILLRNPLIG